jgi:hypothetical protein
MIRNDSEKEKMAYRSNNMQQFSGRQTEQWEVRSISSHILPNDSYIPLLYHAFILEVLLHINI